MWKAGHRLQYLRDRQETCGCLSRKIPPRLPVRVVSALRYLVLTVDHLWFWLFTRGEGARDQNVDAFEEIDHKDFEIFKSEVERIVITKPSDFHSGVLLINKSMDTNLRLGSYPESSQDRNLHCFRYCLSNFAMGRKYESRSRQRFSSLTLGKCKVWV